LAKHVEFGNHGFDCVTCKKKKAAPPKGRGLYAP
jgi:hypothetical protein